MIPGSALPLLIQMLLLICAVPWPAAVFNSVIWLLFAGGSAAEDGCHASLLLAHRMFCPCAQM